MADDESRTIALVEAEVQKFHAKRRIKTICTAANREWRRRRGLPCPVEGEPKPPTRTESTHRPKLLGALWGWSSGGETLLNEAGGTDRPLYPHSLPPYDRVALAHDDGSITYSTTWEEAKAFYGNTTGAADG